MPQVGEAELERRVAGRRFDPVTGKLYNADSLRRDAATYEQKAVRARLVRREEDAPSRLRGRLHEWVQHDAALRRTVRTHTCKKVGYLYHESIVRCTTLALSCLCR